MTHDSIGLGEDGPTHQPIEHLAALRAIPHLLVLRPADGVETAECWEIALQPRREPVDPGAVAPGGAERAHGRRRHENLSAKGAYVLSEPEGGRDVTLIATGSEVGIAVDAADALAKDGVRAAVVSMPSMELFRAQPEAYRAQGAGRGAARRHRGRRRPVLARMARRQGPLRRACPTSAPRRRRRSCSSTSASRPRKVVETARGLVKK